MDTVFRPKVLHMCSLFMVFDAQAITRQKFEMWSLAHVGAGLQYRSQNERIK